MTTTARRAARPAWVVPVGVPLALALVAGLLLRLYGLTAESLWLDEATSLMLARMDVPTLIEWTSLDIHPPLYYTLLHFWIALGEGEAMVRGLSLLASVLALPVMYGLGRTLFDGRTGLVATLLLAVAPFHIWYAQEARMYAWVTLLLSASVLLALLAWQKRRVGLWVAYALVTAAALYTHYYAVFGILLENLFFLYFLIKRRTTPRLLVAWCVSQLAVLLLFAPWLPTFLLPIIEGGGGWLAVGPGRPTLSSLANTAVLFTLGNSREMFPALLRRAGYLLFVGAFLAGLWPGKKRPEASAETSPQAPLYTEREALAFCLLYMALPIGLAWLVSQVGKPMYSARYMMPFLLPFLLLVARGVCNIPQPIVRGVVLLLLVLVALFGVWAQVRVADKPDWRGLAEQLTAQAEQGDLVLFIPGWHAKPFEYYAQGALAVCDDVPVPVDTYGDEALQAVAEAIEGRARVWLVWEEGHYTDPQGAVKEYLAGQMRPIYAAKMPLVGQVILYEREMGGN
ncbi:MAG: hypothetical protein GX552_19435 [Chloroflexi bacterium]|nr:hypothetical protein [Chloroflexota bacterium]